MLWVLLLGIAAAAAYWIWRAHRRWSERARAEKERLASFMAEAVRPARPKVAADALAQEKLLFESAAKAGEAGEAALSIQLYARLLARYPGTLFAGQVRAGVEAQKKKLAKG